MSGSGVWAKATRGYGRDKIRRRRRKGRHRPEGLDSGRLAPGQPDLNAQATSDPVLKRNVAAVISYDRTCDGQSEPDTAGVRTSRSLKPDKRLKDILGRIFRYAGAVVIHRDGNAAIAFAERDARTMSVTNSIFDDVPRNSLYSASPAPAEDPVPGNELHILVQIGKIITQT